VTHTEKFIYHNETDQWIFKNWMLEYNQYPALKTEKLQTRKCHYAPFQSLPPLHWLPQSWIITESFTCPCNLYINEIIPHVFIPVCFLFKLKLMFVTFTDNVDYSYRLFILIATELMIGWIHDDLFIYFTGDGHSCFLQYITYT